MPNKIMTFFKSFTLIIVLVSFVAPDTARAQWVEPGGLANDSRRSFTDPNDMLQSDLIDPDEKMRTWNRAVVWVPTGPGKSRRVTMEELVEIHTDIDHKLPTAIYLHGCAGLWAGSSRRMKFLADNGFLAIAPASFARKKYAMSCDPRIHKGGFYRKIGTLRRIDAGHAIDRAKALPFVDGDNMLLLGLSEGGQTTASFYSLSKDRSVKARIIEGWLCHTHWSEDAGVNAPPSEPVLALLGINDPWFVGWYDTPRDCGSFMNKENGSKSVVYKTGPLSYKHELLESRVVQKEVLAFLREHFDLPMSVRDIQQLLTDLGYNPGPIDGAWGTKTLGALNSLRSDQSLPPVTELEQTSQKMLESLKGDQGGKQHRTVGPGVRDRHTNRKRR